MLPFHTPTLKMATGGCDSSVDSRVVCSVCLEPYRGRQPKLLPCFHTFCLPCLSQLAHTHHQGGDVASRATDEGGQKTVTCPTCRNIVPVPPGGVKNFQSNFYVDSDADTTSPSTSGSVMQDDDPELQEKVKSQVKVMEAVLARLAEKEGEITRQRRALDHDIQTRYAAGLRNLADARDQSLISLRDAAQAAHDKLEAETSVARNTMASLSQLPKQKTQAGSLYQAALLSESALRHFQQISQKKDPKTYFSYSPSDSVTPSFIDSCTQFMGTVLPFGQASDLTVGANSQSPEGVDAEYMDLLSNANLRDDMTSLQAEINTIQQNYISNADYQKDRGSLKADVEKLRTHVCSVEADNARLLKELGDVHWRNITLLMSQPSNVQHDVTTIKADVEKLQTHVSSVEADNARLLKEVNALQGNVTSVQSKSSQLGSSVATVQKTMHKQIAALQDSLANYSRSVAFHARIAGLGVGKQKRVILSQVVTNVGGGYNRQTGIFTAPVSGTYIFMATTNPAGDMSVFTIMVEDKQLCVSEARGQASSTGHAAVELAAGQRVWMESYGDACCFYGLGYTYFSGVLVQAKLQ